MRLLKLIGWIIISLLYLGCKDKYAVLSEIEKSKIDLIILEEYDARHQMIKAFQDAHQQIRDTLIGYDKNIANIDSLGEELAQLIISLSKMRTLFENNAKLSNTSIAKLDGTQYLEQSLSGLDSIVHKANEISLKVTLHKERILGY